MASILGFGSRRSSIRSIAVVKLGSALRSSFGERGGQHGAGLTSYVDVEHFIFGNNIVDNLARVFVHNEAFPLETAECQAML